MYTAKAHAADEKRILEALDAVAALRKKYKDVIVIPEVVTLHDITEHRLSTRHGVTQFKHIFSRQAARFVLNYFRDGDYISPDVFENTVVCALQDYKPQK